MKLVLHHMPGNPLASASVLVRVGWRHEPPRLLGISHFLEHVHYLGSVNYPDIDREMAVYGSEINGPTLAEVTIFSLVSLKEDFLQILPVLLDMVYNPRFDKEAVERERKIVLGATNDVSDYTPWEWVRLKADDIVFQTDELNSLGTEETLRSIRLEDLREWQHRYFHTANSRLLIAGDVEISAVQDTLSKAEIPSTGEQPDIWRHKQEMRFYQQEKEGIHPELYVAFRFNPTKKVLLYELLAILLGNYANSRLFKILRQEDPLAYMVESGIRLLSDVGRFGIYLGIAEVEHEEATWVSLSGLLKTLRVDGFSEEELSWAKRVYKLQLLRNAVNPEKVISFLTKRATWNKLIPDFASMDKQLGNIEQEQIRQLCCELFLPENCFVALVGPSKPIDKERWWSKLA